MTEPGQEVTINPPGQVTYITKNMKGDIIIGPKGFTMCQGINMQHKGRVLSQTMVLQETHLMTAKVKLCRNFNTGEVMIMETGMAIPKYVAPYQTIKPFLGTAQPTGVEGGLVITS